MAGTDFDVIIGGVKAKVVRTQESGGYRRRTMRREVEQQLLSQAESPALVSRADQRQLYQSSWAGGARWWKPILGAQEADSYFRNNFFDLWSEPGKVVPGNRVDDAAETNLHDNIVIATDNLGDTYAIGSTNVTNATYLDVYKWEPALNQFFRDTTVHSGVPVAENPTQMIFDANDDYFYVVNPDGEEITRFSPLNTAQDAAWLSIVGMQRSNLIARHRDGLIYMGSRIHLIDKSGPSKTQKFNDGMGVDLLADIDITGTNPILRRPRLAVLSPSGIYYAKNISQHGQIVSWIYRVEKDEAGNWIGNPIATLPPGTVTLGVMSHLGSLLLLVSPDHRTIVENDTQHAEMQLISINNQSGISVAGSFLGNREELDETPYAFLGAIGSKVYIGGHKRLWVYDASRGGLHTALEWPTALTDGAYTEMAVIKNSADLFEYIFVGKDRIVRRRTPQIDLCAIVTDFGDDETTYALTSNYFDGGLPFEEKELTQVEIMYDQISTGSGGTSDHEWTVQISADDGAFADALVASDADSTYASAQLKGVTGRRFQYRLIHQTKVATCIALRAIKVAFTTGEMITEWDLTLDGDELLNVNNELQDEAAFYDSLVTIGDTNGITTLVDNMQEQAQETADDSTVDVRVQAVEIVKEKPGESLIRVVLREA